MERIITPLGALRFIKFGGKTFGIAIKARRALTERDAMRIRKGYEAIGISVVKHLAKMVMVFAALTRDSHEDGTAKTYRLNRELLIRVIALVEFGGILRDILDRRIRHRANDIEAIRPNAFKDTGSIARLALIEASKIRHPFGRGQIDTKEDKVIMRAACTFSVFTASEITHSERRKTVIARNIAKTLHEVLNVGLFKVFRAMLVTIGKRHEGTNWVLQSFKAHTGNPIGTAFLKARRTFATRHKNRGRMRFNEITRLPKCKRTLTIRRQTAGIIGHSRV
nr:hypothetical protein EQLGYNXF_EQLGYNXF_CDS_0008 [Microvirus sp.]